MRVELLGNTDKEYIYNQIKVVADAGRLSRFPGSVFEICDKNFTFGKNVDFIKRVIGMGHESITDHDYLVFALEDVSILVEQIIILERFSSFTIKSRREVDFSDAGFYMPDFHTKDGVIHPNNDFFKRIYRNYIKKLFDNYSILVNNGIPMEDARYILPQSLNSNIIMGIDAHVLKNMIISFTKGKNSNIPEFRELGEKLYNIMESRTPYLKDIIDNSKVDNIDLVEECLNNLVECSSYDILDKPIMLNNGDDVDEKIIVSALMRVYGCDYGTALNIYDKKIKYDPKLCNEIMKSINSNLTKDELKQVNFQFQIPISYAVLTHLKRHRTHDLLVPDFVPIKNIDNYIIPNSIKKNGFDATYKELFDINSNLVTYFKEQGVRDEDLIGFYLSGNMVNVVTNMDGATLEHFLRLRTCNKAQWEIRNIANEMRNLVRDNTIYYGKILGPTCEVKGICNEGKESCGKIKKLVKDN